MDIEPAANGTLEVYDSCDYQPHKLIASFSVINNTLPMGVSSTFYCMFVRFTWIVPRVCPTQKDCVKFTILVDTSPEPGDVFIIIIIQCSRCLGLHPHNPQGRNVAVPAFVLVFSLVFSPQDLCYGG